MASGRILAWYGTNFRFRLPVTLNATALTGGPYDYNITIPKSLSLFWQNVQSDGYDMALTEWDGITLLDATACTGWDRGASWSKANRTGTLRIDGLQVGAAKPLTDGRLNMMWLYFGASTTEASSYTVGAVALGATQSGEMANEDPSAVTPVWRCRRQEAPDAIVPASVMTKFPNDSTFIYADLSADIIKMRGGYNGRPALDAIRSVRWTSERANVGNSIASYTDAAIVSEKLVRLPITGGTSGQDSTGLLRVTTTSGRELEKRVLIRVQTPEDQ
jgi:hypothetical protein